MILDTVVSLSAFPDEKIGVFLDESVFPESSARFGIRYKSNNWDYPTDQLNWGGWEFQQSGLVGELLAIPSLSDYYDADNILTFKQPTNHCEIPDTFPLFFKTSDIPGHNVELSFKGGTSAISIFPSSPYPVLEKLGDKVFSVEGAFLPLTAFSDLTTFDQLHDLVDPSSLDALTTQGGAHIKFARHSYTGPGSTVYDMCPNAYFSASRQNFVLKTQANKSNATPLTNQTIPAILPYSKAIVPQSFQMTFTVSAATLEEPIDYTIGYGHTLGNFHYLSGIDFSEEGITGLSTHILKSARLDAANAKLNLSLNAGYFVPKGEQYLVTYQASALPYVKSTNPATFVHGISSFESTNYYEISSQEAPYYYNYKFDLDYNTAKPDVEAFTLYFTPEIKTAQPETSTFFLSSVMIDNYQQLEFPILDNRNKIRFRYTEENNDLTLSAIDLNDSRVYTQSQWIPASAHLMFVNDGIANSFTIYPEISTFKNDIFYPDTQTFILNKELANTTLSVSAFDTNWAVVKGNIYPNFDPDADVRWVVEPPNNIKIYNYFEEDGLLLDAQNNISVPPTDEISLNTLTPANELSVVINNLGVDRTKVTLYSAEYDLSAHTFWIPPSAAYNNLTLDLQATTNDFLPTPIASINSYVKKNNMLYPAPTNGSVIWKELNNDPRADFTLYSTDGQQIIENTINTSTAYTNNIQAFLDVDRAQTNPQKVIYNFSANIYGNRGDDPTNDIYSITDSIAIPIRQYPATFAFEGQLSASDGNQYLMSEYNTINFTTTAHDIRATALTSQFLSVGKIVWDIPWEGQTEGNSVVFGVSAGCFGVTALSARPINQTFGLYHFVDQVCINVLDPSYPYLDYLAFPEHNLFPTQTLALDDDLRYLQSTGNGILNGCTTNIVISTFDGFDQYYYTVGTKTVSSTQNTIEIPVMYNDIRYTGKIQISAFNDQFPADNPTSRYNYVISDNSDIFHQHVTAFGFPELSATIQLQNSSIQVRSGDAVNTLLSFSCSAEGVYSTGTTQFILSSDEGLRWSDVYTFEDSGLGIYPTFDINPTNPFATKENSFTTFKVFASGNIVKNPDEVDCKFVQKYQTSAIDLFVYDGPDLEIYVPQNVYTTTQAVSVVNQTIEFPTAFTSFILDDGAGNTYTSFDYQDLQTITYDTPGTYTLSLTGIHPIDGVVTKTWPDLIIVKDQYDAYDSAITRTFPDQVELPWSLKECQVPPNTWQWQNVINTSLDRLYTNFSYLSSQAYTWDINKPVTVIGWWGEKGGRTRWIYDEPPTSAYYTKDIIDLKDITRYGDHLIIINDNYLEFRQDDYNLTLINKTNKITEGEILTNPTHVVWVEETSKLVVLDGTRKNIFVFDVDNHVPTLTHYWGGVGDADSRTHLNNPVDMVHDGQNIYVVDSDSRNIKVYNNFLNWTSQIEHEEWQDQNYPVSMTTSEDSIFVLSSIGLVYKFDKNYVYQSQFSAIPGNKIYHNLDFIYIVHDERVSVYTKDGTPINDLHIEFPINRLVFDGPEILAINRFSVVKLVDYAQKQNITDETAVAYPWSAIAVHGDEVASDFIYNDSFKKIWSSIINFGQSLDKTFVITLDEFDQFYSFGLETREDDENYLVDQTFVPLGINEIVAYETINRLVSTVYAALINLKKMVDVRERRNYTNGLCWTWKYHKIDGPQNLNDNRRPLSWKELSFTSSRFNSSLSGITWQNAVGCGTTHNHSPINWTWEALQDNCVWNRTWEELENGRSFGKTWESIADKCQELPVYSFNPCITSC